tara:strand:- start:838 stop:1179 length:342 start_codon:yes stop_codon:yes gene_type:complete
MKNTILNKEAFDAAIAESESGEKRIYVLVGADWHSRSVQATEAACKAFTDDELYHYEVLVEDYGNNTDKTFGVGFIRMLPSLIVFEHGKYVDLIQGDFNEAAFKHLKEKTYDY